MWLAAESCYWGNTTQVSPSSRICLLWFPVSLPLTPQRLGFKLISHPTSTVRNHRHANESPATIQAHHFPAKLTDDTFCFQPAIVWNFVLYLGGFFRLPLGLCMFYWVAGMTDCILRPVDMEALQQVTHITHCAFTLLTVCAREVVDSRRFCSILL